MYLVGSGCSWEPTTKPTPLDGCPMFPRISCGAWWRWRTHAAFLTESRTRGRGMEPRTGNPGRLSVHGPKTMGRSPFYRSYSANKRQLARARVLVHGVKALEKHRFRPRYALANLGHPSRTIRPWLGDKIRKPPRHSNLGKDDYQPSLQDF